MAEKANPIKFVQSAKVKNEIRKRKRMKGDQSNIGEVAFRLYFGMEIPEHLKKYLEKGDDLIEGDSTSKFVFSKEVRNKIEGCFRVKGDYSKLAEFVFRKFFKMTIYEDLLKFENVKNL